MNGKAAESLTVVNILKILKDGKFAFTKAESLGRGLGLSNGKIAQFKMESPGSLEGLLANILDHWLQNNKPTSWKSLAEALRLCDCRNLANKILLPEDPEPMPEPNEIRVAAIKKNLNTIRAKFATLVSGVSARLESHNVDMRKLRLFIVTFLPDPSGIPDTISMDELFEALSRQKVWDFDNFGLIEGIVNLFGQDNEEAQLISAYKSELAGFKGTTKIIDYIQACSSEEDILRQNKTHYDKRYCHELTMKLKSKSRITTESLNYIDTLWNSIAEEFLIPSLPVVLHTIHKGCIEVTWLLQKDSAIRIKVDVHKMKFFKAHEISLVVMDNKILYYETKSG